MAQISWMFSLIPDAMLNWIYWAIIAIGVSGVVAGWLGRWIPVYGKYAGALKPIGIVILVLGVWLRGGYDTEISWRAKVAEAEAKVAAAEKVKEDRIKWWKLATNVDATAQAGGGDVEEMDVDLEHEPPYSNDEVDEPLSKKKQRVAVVEMDAADRSSRQNRIQLSI